MQHNYPECILFTGRSNRQFFLMFLIKCRINCNIFIRTRIQISCKSNSIEFYTHIQIVFVCINIGGFRKVSIGHRDGETHFVMFVICLYFPYQFHYRQSKRHTIRKQCTHRIYNSLRFLPLLSSLNWWTGYKRNTRGVRVNEGWNIVKSYISNFNRINDTPDRNQVLIDRYFILVNAVISNPHPIRQLST